MNELHQYVLTTLLPIAVGVAAMILAMRIAIAEIRKDIDHIRDAVKCIEATVTNKADKDIVNEMRKDIKDIKEMLTEHIIESAKEGRYARAKKNSTNT